MNYLLYWIVDAVIRQNVTTWLVAIISVLVGSFSKSIWRWCVRQYTNWQDHRVLAAEVKEWEHSLLARDLSLVHGHFVGKRRPIAPVGRKRVKSAGRGSALVAACSSSKGNKGKYGPWAQRNRGPNPLLIAARKGLGWGISQGKAAERLNVDPQELGRWERGQYLPTRKMLTRLTRGYGKSAAELGYGELEQFYMDQYTPKAQHSEQVVEICSSDDGHAQSRRKSDGSAIHHSPAISTEQAQDNKSSVASVVERPSTVPAKRGKSRGKSARRRKGPIVERSLAVSVKVAEGNRRSGSPVVATKAVKGGGGGSGSATPPPPLPLPPPPVAKHNARRSGP